MKEKSHAKRAATEEHIRIPEEGKGRKFPPDRINKIGLATFIVLAAAVFLRFWRLGSVPEGYQIDEMGSVYDAWSLLHYGVDRYRISYPVYFINFGGGQNALLTYLLMISFRLFGVSQFSIRLPGAIASVIMALCGIGIIRIVWKNYLGVSGAVAELLFSGLYLIAPYTQMAARIGLESLLMLGFSTLFLFLFLLALDRQKIGFFFLCGLAGGITLYTYAISYIVLPLFLIFALLYLLRHKKIHIMQAVVFVIPLFILAVPLLLEQYVNITGHEAIRLGPFTVTKLFEYRGSEITFSNIPENLMLTIKSMLFYDWIDYNSDYRFWLFYPMSVPFFFAGIMHYTGSVLQDIQDKKYSDRVFLLLWFCCQFFTGCLLGVHGDTGANPTTNKINGIFFTVMFFIVTGWIYCFRNLQKIAWKKVFAGILAGGYAVYFLFFVRFYYSEFQPSFIWASTYENLCSFINQNDALKNKVVISNKSYIYYLISDRVSPYDVDVREGDYGNLAENGISDDTLYEDADKYGREANYILYKPSEEVTETFTEKGFLHKEEGGCVLFYYD